MSTPARILTVAAAIAVHAVTIAASPAGAAGAAVARPAAMTAADPAPTAGSLSVLTYNVAGLPGIISSGDPGPNTVIIGERVNAYDVVNVQEDFNYHADLYSTARHPHRTSTSGGVPFGSGLNTMSRFPITELDRVKWSKCVGTDCLTPKGFTFKRLRLAEGVHVDLYNLHPNAGSSDADLEARRANITQVSEYIAARSAGNAVIVMGDTNTRYTRARDNIRELVSRNGLTDAWVSGVRGGTPPEAGNPALVCDDATIADECEIVDKILFRGNRLVSLTLDSYHNENAAFRTSDGKMLSDHYPISARLSWSLTPGLRASDTFGGPHGTPFTDVDRVAVGGRVSQVAVRSGERVDQVAVTLENGTVLSHGGSGGSGRSLTLGAGEHLVSVKISTGTKNDRTRVFGVTFTTNHGRTLTGGTSTSQTVTYTAPEGYGISGFTGRSGSEIDKLGVVYTALP